MDHIFRTSSGNTLSYTSVGKGTSLLFIHGGSGRKEWFATMLPLLPPNLQLITVDLPGHGGSFRMERYSLASIAEVIAELLVGLAARPAIVFGHSFGGHVGMVLADRRPDLMKGLIVGDTPLDLAHLKNHLCGSEKMLRHWMTIAGRNLPIDELAILVGQTPIQMAGSEATLGSMFDLQHPYIRELAASLRLHDPAFLEQLISRFDAVHAGFNADSILSRLSIPALFLRADPAAGGMMSEEDVARIKRLAPKSIMEFLPGVSHGLQLQDPERVAATVAEFALADPI